MWGKTRMTTREPFDRLTDESQQDPYAELRPVETLRRSLRVQHDGSVKQELAEASIDHEPTESANAKYWPVPKLGLKVARRFVAMSVSLMMFAGATGGITVGSDQARAWLVLLGA